MVHGPTGSLTEDETGGAPWVVGVVFDDLRGIGPDSLTNIFNVEPATESPVQGVSGHKVGTILKRRDDALQRLFLPALTRRQA